MQVTLFSSKILILFNSVYVKLFEECYILHVKKNL